MRFRVAFFFEDRYYCVAAVCALRDRQLCNQTDETGGRSEMSGPLLLGAGARSIPSLRSSPARPGRARRCHGLPRVTHLPIADGKGARRVGSAARAAAPPFMARDKAGDVPDQPRLARADGRGRHRTEALVASDNNNLDL